MLIGEVVPNNSFKPNLLRYTNHMAERACHVVASATQVGLTQALGLTSKIKGVVMLSRDQAESASEVLLAEKRKVQDKYAETITTKLWPFSVLLRYLISSTTGAAIGAMYGNAQPGGIILWSVIGLAAGVAFGFWLGQMHRRREA